jgi:GTP pyrophosphokinase
MEIPSTISKPDLAIMMARVMHNGQRHGHRSFVQHPAEVVAVLRRFGVDTENLLIAGWLHDIVEDTDFSLGQVWETFGEDVAHLVDALTDVTPSELIEEHGEDAITNRAACKKATYAKLLASPQVSGARIVKLADRIANVEYSWADGSEKHMKMYRTEHEDFAQAMYVRGISGPVIQMQKYLDHLLRLDA